MKPKDFLEAICAFLSLLSLLGLGFSDFKYKVILVVLAAILLLVVCIYKLLSESKEKKDKKKSISNYNVINESTLVCKKLMKIIKTNEKALKRLHIERIHNDLSNDEIKVLHLIKKKRTENNNRKEIKNLEVKKHNKLIKIIKGNCEFKTNFLINEELISSIIDLDRILLQTEQYEARLKLGEYVEKYSTDPKKKIKALIDLQGWTYSLLGKTSQSQDAINKGIGLLDSCIENSDNPNELYSLKLSKARAFRHLGSDHCLSKNKPFEAIEFLKRGQEINNELLTNNNDINLLQNIVGINYGIAEAKYNAYILAIKRKDYSQNNLLDSCLKMIEENIKTAQSFDNKHRYIKYLTLKNKVYIERINSFFSPCSEEKKNILFEEIKVNLEEIKQRLDLNIYADEAIINYLQQRINILYHNIGKLFTNKNE